MNFQLRDVTAIRGEKITELALTDCSEFPRPIFQPAYLGDKWPSIDFYVELNSVRGKRPFFFVQTKSTRSNITLKSKSLAVSTTKRDIQSLLRIPGPTYLIGVHEPSKRAFVRSIHAGISISAITRIPVSYELTSANLRILHSEVRKFWERSPHKPTSSRFS